MLAEWRTTIRTETPARPAMANRSAVAAATTSETATAAREPTLEILYILYKTPQVAAPARAAQGASASETPKPVATPLPPRNLSQTGKQCPRTAPTAQAVGSQAASPRARATGTKPFRASRASVAAAALFPAARATLVAPMFPEPTVRTSLPEVARAMSRPNGIDPHRYAKRSQIIAPPGRASWRRRRRQPPIGRSGAESAAPKAAPGAGATRSEEHTSELQSRGHLVCRLLLEKKKKTKQLQAE